MSICNRRHPLSTLEFVTLRRVSAVICCAGSKPTNFGDTHRLIEFTVNLALILGILGLSNGHVVS